MTATTYKLFRASTEPTLHILCAGGIPEFDRLPDRLRRLGPWQGATEGPIDRLRPHYRALLAEQGFIVFHRRQDLLKLES